MHDDNYCSRARSLRLVMVWVGGVRYWTERGGEAGSRVRSDLSRWMKVDWFIQSEPIVQSIQRRALFIKLGMIKWCWPLIRQFFQNTLADSLVGIHARGRCFKVVSRENNTCKLGQNWHTKTRKTIFEPTRVKYFGEIKTNVGYTLANSTWTRKFWVWNDLCSLQIWALLLMTDRVYKDETGQRMVTCETDPTMIEWVSIDPCHWTLSICYHTRHFLKMLVNLCICSFE